MQKTGKTILSYFLLSALFMTTNKATSPFKRTRSAPPILHRKEVITKLSDMLKNGLVSLPTKKMLRKPSFLNIDIHIDTTPPANFFSSSFFFNDELFFNSRIVQIKRDQPNLRPDPFFWQDPQLPNPNLRPDPLPTLNLRPNPFP